jgi:rhamnosyltransferase
VSARVRSACVFIPTWNAGAELAAVLESIRAQEAPFPFSIRAIDSSSTDGTQDVLRRFGVTFTVIPRADFDHGSTRNRGVLESDAEAVALLSQDARPADRHWLASLAAPFADPKIAGAWALQVPRPDCHPFQRLTVGRHMDTGLAAQIVEPLNAAQWAGLSPAERLARLGFDDVSSMVRRRAIETLPFPKAAFGEDMLWARAALLAGWRLAFAPAARVLHSHALTRHELGRRTAQTHELRRRLCDFVPVRSRAVQIRRTLGWTLRFARAGIAAKHLPLASRLRALILAFPCAALQIESMYRGAHAATYDPPA